ncbi:MAG: sigma-70 family RNA polymerase sigma factor [Caldilineaceae bacterium]
MQSYESFVIVACTQQAEQAQRHAAFAQLVRQFRGMALTYAYRVLGDEQLAQDVTQEAFLTAYQQLAQLREPAAFPGWLRRIVHTHCHRVTRRKQPDNVPLACLDRTLPFDDDLAQQIADADATQALVDWVLNAVADLPDHERTVVRLFYLDGYSIRDVAQALDLPVTTIKKRLQYARDRLRKRLLDHCKQGGMTLQSWSIQIAQVILPLFAVMTAAPVLCPVPVTQRRLPR